MDQGYAPEGERSRTDSGSETSECSPERIDGANRLLDYAITCGVELDPATIEAVRAAHRTPAAASAPFDAAYQQLAARMHPITAETLLATERPQGRRAKSEAEQWSWFLWKWTIGLLLVISLSEAWDTLVSSLIPVGELTDAEVFDEASRWPATAATVLDIYLPFFYGALGASAYLIRKCQQLIAARTFDSLRKGEYLNRLLLGLVSGGVVGLFGEDLFDSETLGEIGGATAAFLAGYNTDFVFTAIERLVAAILPKVEAQRASAENPNQDEGPAPRPETQ